MNQNETYLRVKRDYKSRIFTMLFSEKERLLELYNAVSGNHYTNTDDLTINTLENAIYMSMKNDISFFIDSRLSLYEHQSTNNPNMPIRFFFYLADLYSGMVKDKNIYGSRLVTLPTPRFIAFYNGIEERPEREILLLSDSFRIKESDVSLELKVEVLNINKGYNKELLNTCKTLADYAEITERIRTYAKKLPLAVAVSLAVDECIRENILRDFLEKHRAEVEKMWLYEYDEEKHMQMEREENFEAGYEVGINEGRKSGIIEERRKLFHLFQKMSEDGLENEAARLLSEPDFLDEMLKYYQI